MSIEFRSVTIAPNPVDAGGNLLISVGAAELSSISLSEIYNDSVGHAGKLCYDLSPDTNYLITGESNSPFVRIYRRSGDAFNQISFSSGVSSGVSCVRFSPKNNRVAVALDNGTVYVYAKSGNTFSLNTTITNRTTAATDLAFDLSEVWFFTARHNTGVEDGLAGYKGPAKYNMYGYPSPPPAQPKNARFNAYGQLFVSCNVQPYLRTYEYNTAVSGMTTPHKEVSILSPVPVNNLDSFSFSTDGNTVCLSSASTLMVYRKSGESYELLEDISNMAEGSIYSSTISSDGTYLFYTDAGGLHILKAQDSAYTQEASLDIQLTNLLLSSDDKYLIGSIVSNNKYYRHIYKCTIT